MANDDTEREEEPTAKKRGEALKKGQIAISQELFTFANLVSVTLALTTLGSPVILEGMSTFRNVWIPPDHLDVFEATRMLRSAFGAATVVAFPVFTAVVVGGVLMGLIQTKGNIATDRLKPKFEKLNPIKGFSRVFKKDGPINLGKAAMKIATIGVVLMIVASRHIDQYQGLSDLPLLLILKFIFSVIIEAYLYGALMLLFIALGDYAWQNYSTEKSLKMSKQEVKEEHRQSEGDPAVRSRLRSLQMERGRTRMMEAVPDADVVVTNPEHISVAIQYARSDMSAPTVIAKGGGHLAMRIREIARENGIPIVENKPVARSLYRTVKVGQQIPEKLYQAVAEILAYVYKLDRSKANAW